MYCSKADDDEKEALGRAISLAAEADAEKSSAVSPERSSSMNGESDASVG